MGRILFSFLISVSIFLPVTLSAQRVPKADIGISVGSTLFFGDLGGANTIGRPFFFDLEKSLVQPVGMLSYHYQFSDRFALRIQGAYTSIAGDDKLLQPKALFAPEWFRWFRNLDFHSKLWEISAQAEFYFVRYQPGSLVQRWGPYFLLGGGVFHFNPKTTYNGTEVSLRPLRTEGEGFPGSGVKEYSLYQFCVPVGLGIRYNVTNDFTLGFEYADRKTFTDYIDDVSTEYVSPADFSSFFSNDPATAALATTLAMRADELSIYGEHTIVTAPGQQRGQPKNKDHYIFPVFSFYYVIGGPKHLNKRQQTKCMKWGGSGGQSKVHKYHK